MHDDTGSLKAFEAFDCVLVNAVLVLHRVTASTLDEFQAGQPINRLEADVFSPKR